MQVSQDKIQGLIEHLSEFVTENKKDKMVQVLNFRTKHVTVVLEDIYQPQNASAVIRTCDCLGIQDVYVIENHNEYVINRDVTKGSSKWVDIHRFNDEGTDNTMKCINDLKSSGYQIVATSPHASQTTPQEINIDKPMALFFGHEQDGISSDVLSEANEHLVIPMYGFTESFNLSVSAAICLTTILNRLRDSDIDINLTVDERDYLFFEWMKRTVKNGDVMVKEFLSKIE